MRVIEDSRCAEWRLKCSGAWRSAEEKQSRGSLITERTRRYPHLRGSITDWNIFGATGPFACAKVKTNRPHPVLHVDYLKEVGQCGVVWSACSESSVLTGSLPRKFNRISRCLPRSICGVE